MKIYGTVIISEQEILNTITEKLQNDEDYRDFFRDAETKAHFDGNEIIIEYIIDPAIF